jgi:hypothetical protein
MRTNERLRRRRKGLQVVGPGFYLWDPDAREALSLAAELSRRSRPVLVRRRRSLERQPVA